MASGIPLKSLATGVEWVQLLGGGIGLGSARQVRVYLRGTTTPIATFSDQGLSVPLTQPLTTDATGGVPGYIAAEQQIDFLDVASGLRAQAEPFSVADIVGTDGKVGGAGTVGLPGSVDFVGATGSTFSATEGQYKVVRSDGTVGYISPAKTYADAWGVKPSNSAAANTTALQALIAALPSTGASIEFAQSSVYNFDATSASPFTFAASNNALYQLVGQGSGRDEGSPSSVAQGTRLKRSAGTNPLIASSGDSFSTRLHLDVRGLELNGGGLAGDLVSIGSGQDCLWDDVRLQLSTGRLIHMIQWWNCRFRHCFFRDGGSGTGAPAVNIDARAGDGPTGGSVVVHFDSCEWESNNGTDIQVDGSVPDLAPSKVLLFNGCKAERQILGQTWPLLRVNYGDRVIWSGGSMSPGAAQEILSGSYTSGVNTITLGVAAPGDVTTTMTVGATGFAHGTTITAISPDRLTLTCSNNATQTVTGGTVVVNGTSDRAVEIASTNTGLVVLGPNAIRHNGDPDRLIDFLGGRLIIGSGQLDAYLAPPTSINIGSGVTGDGFRLRGVIPTYGYGSWITDNRSNVVPAGQAMRRIPIEGSSGSASRTAVGSFQAWQMPHGSTSTIFGAIRLPEDLAPGVAFNIVIHPSSPSAGNVRYQLQLLDAFDGTDVTAAPGTTFATTQNQPGSNHSIPVSLFVSGTAFTTGTKILIAISRLGADGADVNVGVVNIDSVDLLYWTQP